MQKCPRRMTAAGCTALAQSARRCVAAAGRPSVRRYLRGSSCSMMQTPTLLSFAASRQVGVSRGAASPATRAGAAVTGCGHSKACVHTARSVLLRAGSLLAMAGLSGAAYSACADAGASSHDGTDEAESGQLEDDYEILEIIGRGHFATVRKARHRQTGELVAVKQIAASRGRPGDPAFKRQPSEVRREIDIMRRIGAPSPPRQPPAHPPPRCCAVQRRPSSLRPQARTATSWGCAACTRPRPGGRW